MTWPTGIVVFVIIWWCVFFTVLPWGNRAPDEPELGHADSAPANPRILLKAGITTAIAAILWGVAFYLIETDAFSFRAVMQG